MILDCPDLRRTLSCHQNLLLELYVSCSQIMYISMVMTKKIMHVRFENYLSSNFRFEVKSSTNVADMSAPRSNRQQSCHFLSTFPL